MSVERQRSEDQPDQAQAPQGARGSEEVRDSGHADSAGGDRGDGGQQAAAPRVAPLSAAEAGKTALEQIVGLTGKPPAGIISLQQAEGGWIVGVEVVEDSRVPSTSDMLALYEVQVGDDRSLLGYKRTRRYLRSQSQNG